MNSFIQISMTTKEPTNLEIIEDLHETVQALATHMDQRFSSIEQRMVTKDYLDDRISSLRGELVVLTRREDAKLASLVEELYSEESLSAAGRKTVLGMEPFARRV
jgi:hypothetical protein